jgi:predicted nucleic acid-binding protein
MVKSFVLDCSATVGICLGDKPEKYYIQVFQRLLKGDEAIVPPLWHYELGNGLLNARKKRKITSDLATEFLETLQSFAIKTVAPDWVNSVKQIEEVMYLASMNGLTFYDASYFALALRLQLPLATTDHALKKAALTFGIRDAVAS